METVTIVIVLGLVVALFFFRKVIPNVIGFAVVAIGHFGCGTQAMETPDRCSLSYGTYLRRSWGGYGISVTKS